MAIFRIKCGVCSKGISPDMSFALEQSRCPYCGSPMDQIYFDALEDAAALEEAIVGCNSQVTYVQREKIIAAILSAYKLPPVEMVPEETDKVTPVITTAPPAAIRRAPVALDTPLAVGQTEGRDGATPAMPTGKVAKAGGVLPMQEPVVDLLSMNTERATRYSDGLIEFGDRPQVLATPGSGNTGGAARKLSEIADPVTPDRSYVGGAGSRPTPIPQ